MLTPRRKLVIAAAGLTALLACQPPTQFEVVMSTDIECSKLRGVAIVAGSPGEVSTKDPATVNAFCEMGGQVATEASLGSVMIVPSGERDAKVGVRLVAGVDEKDAETCVKDLLAGATDAAVDCVIARRSIAFLPQRPFALPIALTERCVGKVCATGETCIEGECRSEEVDPEQCLTSEGCGDEVLYLHGATTKRRVFVTSKTMFGASIGGLTKADALCQKLADDAGLRGTYLAWLSTDKASPASRFKKDGPGWALVDGTLVANDWADLTDGSLQHAIDQTEKGASAPTTSACSETMTPVWSQTTADGTFAYAGEPTASDPKWDCGDWTSVPGTSQNNWGDAGASDGGWTRLGNCNTFGVACTNNLAALYCFEQ